SGYGTWLLARYALSNANPKQGVVFTAARTNLAAFIAGCVFAFAPVRMAHLLGHMQVLSTEWLPFFVLAYVRMASGVRQVSSGRLSSLGRTVRMATLPAIFLALNALCDWYFVLYAMFFVGIVVVWKELTELSGAAADLGRLAVIRRLGRPLV